MSRTAPEAMHSRSLPLVPPTYCQYVGEACDQLFDVPAKPMVFFAYPSQPAPIASSIASAIKLLKHRQSGVEWLGWEAMEPQGQTIFCRICASMRRSQILVADLSTLNFNVMFEVGYAIGLGMPVIPIRDTSVITDARIFAEIGLLDSLGYVDFTNAEQLAEKLVSKLDTAPLPDFPVHEQRDQPVYLMKSPIPVDGSLALQSTLKKARLRYRAFDPVETPRLSLHDARRQVAASKGVAADLIDLSRDRAKVHNSRSALVCGMAMAQEKAVLMLQEEFAARPQPLDYRDVVRTYRDASNVPGLMRDFLSDVVELMQTDRRETDGDGRGVLSSLDLGDVAAENEIEGLRHYFVTTGQSVQAQQGHARLVIGRKGSGKTAIFYRVRRGVARGHTRLVIDLKPEGHQFLQMKEDVLERLGPGLQEHTMVAFWHYLLLAEIARYALDRDRSVARLDPLTSARYDKLEDAYGPHDPGRDLDFSQRLLYQVDRVTRRLGTMDASEIGAKLTEVMYSGEYRSLNDAVREYLRSRDAIWLLIDNLDKGWPIRAASGADILIVRSLLEATRKLQREFTNQELDFHCLVFLRTDIYEMLRESTPDKGKDTAIRLDWEDPQAFEQIMLMRLRQTLVGDQSFDELWTRICEPLVDGQGSFDYIVDRTLMRPRDLLKFVRHCVDTAMNRGRDRITADDILQAERLYSSDLLTETAYEISDTHPELADVLWVFEGAPVTMTQEEALDRLSQLLGVDESEAAAAFKFLLWFGFLGVRASDDAEVRYAYDVQGNIQRLIFALRSADSSVVIHPGFRVALDVS